MRKFVNYFKVEIPRTDNYMNMIDETRPEQQAAWLERDGKHLTNAHKIANRDVQHPPTVMLDLETSSSTRYRGWGSVGC